MAKESKSRFRQACLSVFSLLAMTSSVAAQSWTVDFPDFDPCTAQMPPAEYRYIPLEPYTVHYVSEADVFALCEPPGMEYIFLLGCADVPNRAVYVVDNLQNDRWTKCVLTHEIAHLNGWPADHPTAFRPIR